MLSRFLDPFFGFGDEEFYNPFNHFRKMQNEFNRAFLQNFYNTLHDNDEESQENDKTSKKDTNSSKKDDNVTQKIFSRSSTYQSTSNGNGVEEVKESYTDEDGETHESTSRRIGDRWHRIESHSKKDGSKTIKETWHNVSKADKEKFDSEWNESRKSLGFAPETSKKAIENSKKQD